MSVDNIFLQGAMGRLFLRTAAPIILIMGVSGLYVVVDAGFIGLYAGADALSAVTLIFPVSMLMVALQSLVASGMASLVARALGAGDRERAGRLFFSAHGLALTVSLMAAALYWLAGPSLIEWASDGDHAVAGHARSFLGIMITASPVAFLLSLHLDALRCEGRMGFMSLATVAASLLNIAFNWVLLAVLHLGVAGSALGTVMAQVLCLSAVVLYRVADRSALRPLPGPWRFAWRDILGLGAPSSLGFIGVSLTSAAVIANIALWSTSHHAVTVAAYGIATRILTFAYLPLMGVSAALQTIAGNNFGARRMDRVGAALKLALAVALVYCALVEIVVLVFSGEIGRLFVSDPAVIAETARILPLMVAVYAIVGQAVMLSGYFQALGDARHAAAFGLARPYLFSIPFAFLLPLLFGETGIWLAPPAADIAMLLLGIFLLRRRAGRTGWKYGMLPIVDGSPSVSSA